MENHWFHSKKLYQALEPPTSSNWPTSNQDYATIPRALQVEGTYTDFFSQLFFSESNCSSIADRVHRQRIRRTSQGESWIHFRLVDFFKTWTNLTQLDLCFQFCAWPQPLQSWNWPTPSLGMMSRKQWDWLKCPRTHSREPRLRNDDDRDHLTWFTKVRGSNFEREI